MRKPNLRFQDSRGVTYESNYRDETVRLSDRPVDAKRRTRKNLSRGAKRGARKIEK